jgi:chromosome partitioning protein
MLDWFKRIGAPAVAVSTKPAPAAETKVDRLADRLEAIAKAEHAAHSHRPEVKVERVVPAAAEAPAPVPAAAAAAVEEGEVAEVEVAEVEAAEVEVAEVQAAEVQAAEVQAAEVQVAEVQAAEVQAAEPVASEVVTDEAVDAEGEADEIATDDVAEVVSAMVVETKARPAAEESPPVIVTPAKVAGLGSAANDTASGPFSDTRIIVVAGQKGGSGKTTIAAHLAIRALMAGNGPVVLVDTDPQGSLTEWWRARNDDDLAMLTVRNDHLASDLAQLHHSKAALAVIDTPPALTGSIEQVMAVADLVVIPARPSPHDLRAIGATVELVRRAGKPFLFVVNGAAPRANITAEAVAALSEHGPVAPVILYQRTDYAASMIDGRTVLETATSGRSAQEVADLWKYVYPRVTIRAAA